MNPTAPVGTALQLSGGDEQGRPILSIVAKRTYRIERGRCVVAEHQEPLVTEPVQDPTAAELLIADADIFPYKPLTDVVVSGHAYNHPRQRVFDTELRVGAVIKQLRLHGDRHASFDRTGKVLYSTPSMLDALPLSYAFAYGGTDLEAERAYGNPAELFARYAGPKFTPAMIAAASPFRYPRNPCGRGYVIEQDPAAIDALKLPNIEDPNDPLSPERLLLRDPDRWPAQPAPAGYGWLDYGCFPRVAYLGLAPEYDPSIDPHLVSEIRHGHCDADILRADRPNVRCANGASLGLSLPHLVGNEEFALLNLHPHSPRFAFQLPSQRPRLAIDGRDGKLVETEPVVHSVLLDLTRELVCIVWRGSALARRVYREELTDMPFEVEWPC